MKQNTPAPVNLEDALPLGNVSTAIIQSIDTPAPHPFGAYDLTGLTIKSLPITEGLVARFAAKVSATDNPDDCWLWTGSKTAGYGTLSHGADVIYAHRLACTLAHGTIPEGLQARHSCDTPLCVNPSHLRIGTHAQNMQDMMEHGRGRSHVLTRDQVAEIKRMGHSGAYGISAITELYDVTDATISHILTGRKHAMVRCSACEAGTCPQIVRKPGTRYGKMAVRVLAEEIDQTVTTTTTQPDGGSQTVTRTRTRRLTTFTSFTLEEIFSVLDR